MSGLQNVWPIVLSVVSPGCKKLVFLIAWPFLPLSNLFATWRLIKGSFSAQPAICAQNYINITCKWDHEGALLPCPEGWWLQDWSHITLALLWPDLVLDMQCLQVFADRDFSHGSVTVTLLRKMQQIRPSTFPVHLQLSLGVCSHTSPNTDPTCRGAGLDSDEPEYLTVLQQKPVPKWLIKSSSWGSRGKKSIFWRESPHQGPKSELCQFVTPPSAAAEGS